VIVRCAAIDRANRVGIEETVERVESGLRLDIAEADHNAISEADRGHFGLTTARGFRRERRAATPEPHVCPSARDVPVSLLTNVPIIEKARTCARSR
jgi:hypothetical protein